MVEMKKFSGEKWSLLKLVIWGVIMEKFLPLSSTVNTREMNKRDACSHSSKLSNETQDTILF